MSLLKIFRPIGEAVEGLAKGVGQAAKETAKVIKKNPILLPLIAANPQLLPFLSFGAIPTETAMAVSQILRMATPFVGLATGGLPGFIAGLGITPELDKAVAATMQGSKFSVPDLSKLLLFGAVTTPPKEYVPQKRVSLSPEAMSLIKQMGSLIGIQPVTQVQSVDFWQKYYLGQ